MGRVQVCEGVQSGIVRNRLAIGRESVQGVRCNSVHGVRWESEQVQRRVGECTWCKVGE